MDKEKVIDVEDFEYHATSAVEVNNRSRIDDFVNFYTEQGYDIIAIHRHNILNKRFICMHAIKESDLSGD